MSFLITLKPLFDIGEALDRAHYPNPCTVKIAKLQCRSCAAASMS
jgi:hypothetical protein